MAEIEAFLEQVRRALGRREADPPPASDATPFHDSPEEVQRRAEAVLEAARARAEELMEALEASARRAGWSVFRAASEGQAAEYIASLAAEHAARLLVRSTHPAVERLNIEAALTSNGVRVVTAGDEGFRDAAAQADIGLTGVDYALADTGTVVLLSRRGVSRLVSLLPPVHVAVVEPGQVLPDLEELFTLRRADLLRGRGLGYMNLITGPSRSADIEQTLVQGVHGPGEVHLVLLG